MDLDSAVIFLQKSPNSKRAQWSYKCFVDHSGMSAKLHDIWAAPQATITEARLLLTLGANPECLYKDDYGQKTLMDRVDSGTVCDKCVVKFNDFLEFAGTIYEEMCEQTPINIVRGRKCTGGLLPICMDGGGMRGLVSVVCLLFASRRNYSFTRPFGAPLDEEQDIMFKDAARASSYQGKKFVDGSFVANYPLNILFKVVGQDLTTVEMAQERCHAHNIPFVRISPKGINVRIDQIDDGKLMDMIWTTQLWLNPRVSSLCHEIPYTRIPGKFGVSALLYPGINCQCSSVEMSDTNR
ncbi:hypothetical protein TELCIR_10955 [Teladorsagia circumcincta]|uniref:PNPLA domain-containing protein n=1 Tax=Teladorsagia circumcincta TaxID=45464 RepID=A0A2G9UAP7_TELCI|nr:hypothetical protein TELCIR_10955 [Teladorsagia circumcincta]